MKLVLAAIGALCLITPGAREQVVDRGGELAGDAARMLLEQAERESETPDAP